eukprot:5212420-Prymnesium_polylepis.1
MEEGALLDRKKRNRSGQLTYPGLPNGSAANQEDDQLLATSRSSAPPRPSRSWLRGRRSQPSAASQAG